MYLCALPTPPITMELGAGEVKRSGIWCEERAESALSPCVGSESHTSDVRGGRRVDRGPGLALAAAEAPGSSKPPSDLLGLEPGTGKSPLNSDSLKCTYQGNQDPRVAK